MTASDYAAWFGAIGTVGTLLVATAAFLISVLDRQREQARLIALVVDREEAPEWTPKTNDPHEKPSGYRQLIKFHIENRSDGVITQLTARLETIDLSLGVKGYFMAELTARRSYGPGDTSFREGHEGPTGDVPAVLYIEFKDSAGRNWRRYQSGKLVRRRSIHEPQAWDV